MTRRTISFALAQIHVKEQAAPAPVPCRMAVMSEYISPSARAQGKVWDLVACRRSIGLDGAVGHAMQRPGRRGPMA
jgi:hypothetical protein